MVHSVTLPATVRCALILIFQPRTTVSPHSTQPRVPGYALGAPTEADALASLHRVFGSERGQSVWSDACDLAGIAPGAVNTTTDLERVARSLASQGGAAATIARSITIRLRTYNQLAARAAAAKTGARA